MQRGQFIDYTRHIWLFACTTSMQGGNCSVLSLLPGCNSVLFKTEQRGGTNSFWFVDGVSGRDLGFGSSLCAMSWVLVHEHEWHYIAQMDLLDSARARKCLAGKYIVMLGDSTMSETMHDLVMLLSGLAVTRDAMSAYMTNATRCPHLLDAVRRLYHVIYFLCTSLQWLVQVFSLWSQQSWSNFEITMQENSQARGSIQLRDLGPYWWTASTTRFKSESFPPVALAFLTICVHQRYHMEPLDTNASGCSCYRSNFIPIIATWRLVQKSLV